MLQIPPIYLWSFLDGFVGFIIFGFIVYGVSLKYPSIKAANAKTANTRILALSILNLIIVAIGVSISVTALVIATGGSNMTPEQLAEFTKSAYSLTQIIYVLLGIGAGAVLLWIIHFIIVAVSEHKKQRGTQQEIETTISSRKLESVTKEIEEYRKAKTQLDGFFNKIQGTTSNKEDKEQEKPKRLD